MPDDEQKPEPEQLGLMPDAILPAPRGYGYPPRGGGRKFGSKNKSHEALARLARGYTPDIVRRLCELALNDNTILGIAAAKLILDRTWPKPKHSPVHIDLTQLGQSSRPDLQAIMGEILTRTASGDLAPEAAHMIASIVKDVARVADQAPAAAAQAGMFADDPREELARRWTRLFEAENGNGHGNGDSDGDEESVDGAE